MKVRRAREVRSGLRKKREKNKGNAEYLSDDAGVSLH